MLEFQSTSWQICRNVCVPQDTVAVCPKYGAPTALDSYQVAGDSASVSHYPIAIHMIAIATR